MPSRPIGLWAVLGRLRNLVSRRDLLTPADPHSKQPASIWIRQVDSGSCNDAELEITALMNPYYDLERYGLHVVSSPRHADVLLVTGPVTRSMRDALLSAFDAMPLPRRVVTAGDGFGEGGIFGGSYAVVPLPDELAVTRVAHVPGDPPTPREMLEVLSRLPTK
jgi:Ni,Fe-hydrogenase III small subunit